jgi:hypothetical protein
MVKGMMRGLNKYLDDNAFEASPAVKATVLRTRLQMNMADKTVFCGVGGGLVDFKNVWTSILKS